MNDPMAPVELDLDGMTVILIDTSIAAIGRGMQHAIYLEITEPVVTNVFDDILISAGETLFTDDRDPS